MLRSYFYLRTEIMQRHDLCGKVCIEIGVATESGIATTEDPVWLLCCKYIIPCDFHYLGFTVGFFLEKGQVFGGGEGWG